MALSNSPTRFQVVRLADTTHKLPMPGAGGRLFPAEGELVDTWNPFWMMCLADGSVVLGASASSASSKAKN
jgi:hypothetical protein